MFPLVMEIDIEVPHGTAYQTYMCQPSYLQAFIFYILIYNICVQMFYPQPFITLNEVLSKSYLCQRYILKHLYLIVSCTVGGKSCKSCIFGGFVPFSVIEMFLTNVTGCMNVRFLYPLMRSWLEIKGLHL